MTAAQISSPPSPATSTESRAPGRGLTVALFAGIAVLYAAALNPHWRISPDSGRYLTMAHQLAGGQGYTFAGNAQYGLPPALPALYAVVFRVTGFEPSVDTLTRGFTIINAFGLLLGYLGIVAAYFFLREVAGARTALVVAVLVAASRYLNSSLAALSDVPYCAVSWTALFLLAKIERRPSLVLYNLLAVSLALSVLFRIVGAALVGAVVLHSLWRLCRRPAERGTAWRICAASIPGTLAVIWLLRSSLAAAGTAAFSYFNMAAAGRHPSQMALRAAENLGALPGYLFEAVTGLDSIAGLSLVLLALVIWGLATARERGMALAGTYFVVYLLLVGAGVGLELRLALPLLPMLYLYAGKGVAEALRRLTRNPSAVVKVLAALVLIVNLGHAGKTLVENRSPSFYGAYSHGKWLDYIDLAAHKDAFAPVGRVLVPAWGPVHMLTGWDTVITPHALDVVDRPEEFLAAYAGENGVRRIVIDPEYGGERGEALRRFLGSGKVQITGRTQFGRLTVIEIAEIEYRPRVGSAL